MSFLDRRISRTGRSWARPPKPPPARSVLPITIPPISPVAFIACLRHEGMSKQSNTFLDDFSGLTSSNKAFLFAGRLCPPHPSPSPQGEGACGRPARWDRPWHQWWPIVHPLLGERAGVRGTGAPQMPQCSPTENIEDRNIHGD